MNHRDKDTTAESVDKRVLAVLQSLAQMSTVTPTNEPSTRGDLELRGVTVVAGGNDGPTLLSDVSAQFQRGELCALIGPSGSGKTTLIRTVAGMYEPEEGEIYWNGQNLEEEDLPPSQIGYVPQFTISNENLTASENVQLALRLRVGGIEKEKLIVRTDELLDLTGLASAAGTVAKNLSGGQRRRLGLAMELCSEPSLLLCDEVTSGLDPQSEKEILALLRRIAHEGNRVVLVVTHGLSDLGAFDSVAVLSEGRLAYCGPADAVAHYFRAETPEEIFVHLPSRTGEEWHGSWVKHRSYFDKCSGGGDGEDTEDPASQGKKLKEDAKEVVPPKAFEQLLVLLGVKWKIFFRNRSGIAMQIGLILGFPLVVAIFAANGLPAVPSLDPDLNGDVVRQLVEARMFTEGASRAGSMVSGLVLLQVILLGLMGANNSAREISGERQIFEKDRFAGLNPAAYVGSKVIYLAVLVMLQSAWMTWFVRAITGFPGDVGQQFMFYLMVNALTIR
jgi:ABC transport system ATP-binding/permease protein